MTFGSSSIGCFDPFDSEQYTAEAAPILGGPPIGQDRYELLVCLLCLLLLCLFCVLPWFSPILFNTTTSASTRILILLILMLILYVPYRRMPRPWYTITNTLALAPLAGRVPQPNGGVYGRKGRDEGRHSRNTRVTV